MYDKTQKLKEIDEVIANGFYKDNWDSLSQHQVPQWFKDSKFGIFIHWGVYSVPAFSCEWYSRNMYIKESKEYNYHLEHYGNHKDFGYKDFIPLFKAQNFNPQKWVTLFKQAGARYVIPVAEHHDGFQMYKSQLSKWNAFEMGPQRDVIGELTEEINRQGLINGASTHRIEHWFFMGHGKEFESDITDNEKLGDFYWPAMEEQNHHDIFSKPIPTTEFLEDWMLRTIEIIDRFHVKQLYFDWWIQHSSAKPYLKKIAAYYYNRALEWNEEVMIVYKHDAFMFGTATIDIERGQFAEVKPYFWQTDTAIAKNSWCYTQNNDFKKAKDIICDLVDIVSKNGSLLLNVGPKSDGTITHEDTEVLLQIGDWLKINGEAIYESRPWRVAQEGPTLVQEGQFTDANDKVFTSADFRFTVKGSSLYVFSMKYPKDGLVTVKSLALADASKLPKFCGIIKDISMLGLHDKIEWTRDQDGLHIQGPKLDTDKVVVFKVVLD